VSAVVECLCSLFELGEATLKILKKLKSLSPPHKHGILTLLYGSVELDQIFEILKQVDEGLLVLRPYINTLNNVDEALHKSAKELVSMVYGKYHAFLRLMNMKRIRRSYLKRIHANPTIRVSVEQDLKQINYNVPGEAEITLDNPVLLWECHCNVPEKYVRSNIPCRIHKKDINNIITNAFRTGLVEIEYKSLKIYWKNLRTLWPPSIDSLHFVNLIDKHVPLKQLRSILDVGSGTGFLGIYLFHKKGIKDRVVLSDLFLTPLFSSLYNAYVNLSSKLFRSVVITASNGLDYFIEQNKNRFDLIVCAPPYLPHLNEPSILSLDAVAGTYLMEDVIVRGGKLSNSLMICYSSLAEPEFQRAINKAKKLYGRLNVTYLAEVKVPFRVIHALLNEKYMKSLLSNRRKYLIEGPQDSPFKYWHIVKYCLINYI
jgi:SAM-dependent methyltransferase